MANPSKLVDRGVTGLVWLTSSSAAKSAVQLGVLAVLARLLTPEDFGIVAAATAVTGFTHLFSQLGVGPALVQLPEIDDRDVDTAYLATLVLSGTIAGLLWLATPWVVDFYDMRLLNRVFPVLVLLVPINAFWSTSENLVQRELDYAKLAVIDFSAYTVGMGVIGIGAALAGLGVWALVFGQLSRSALKAVMLFSSHSFRFRGQVSLTSLKKLTRLGGGFTLATVFNYLARRGDYIVVGRLLSADALGLYSKAYALMDAGNKVLGQAMSRVIFPSVAKLQHDQRRLSLLFEHGLAGLALITLPVVVVMALYAEDIVLLVLGPQWEAAGNLLRILSFGLFLRLAYKVGGNLARGTGAVYRQSLVQFIYAFAIVGGAALAINLWGITGAAWSTLFGLAINYVLLSWLGMTVSGASMGQFVRSHSLGLLAGLATLFFLLPYGHLTGTLELGRWLSLLGAGVVVAGVIIGALFVDLGDAKTTRWIRSQIRSYLARHQSE